MRNLLFLLNHLACMYALRIAPGTTNVNPMQQNISIPDGSNFAQKKQTSIFCFTIVTPEEHERTDLVIKQLSECDRYQVFSTFNDPERGIVRLYDDLRQNKVGGWTNLTLLLATAWDHIATFDEQYDWYVKVDPDTFFRPRHLRKLFLWKEINPSHVLGFGTPPGTASRGARFQGGMEVLSKAAFIKLKPIFHNPLAMYNYKQTLGTTNEDVWIGDALRKMGGQVHPTPRKNGCWTILLWGLSHQFKRDIDLACKDKHSLFYQAGFCVIQEDKDVFAFQKLKDSSALQEDADNEDVFANTNAHFCVSEDVIALHPIKNPRLYQQLQTVDAMLLQKELSAR